ncbi:MAG: sugar transferase [bacterium]
MKKGTRTLLLLLGDILALFGAFWAMLYISYGKNLSAYVIDMHSLPFLFIGALWLVIFFIFDLYSTQSTRPTIPQLRNIFIAFIIASAVAVIFFYVIPFFGIAPKTNLFIFAGMALILFILWRRLFYSVFSSYFRKNVAFLVSRQGTGLHIEDFSNYFANSPQSGFISMGAYPSLEDFSRKYAGKFPDVFIVSKDVWRTPETFKKLYATESEIMDLAYAYEYILGRIPVEAIDEDWFIHNLPSSRRKTYDIEKRVSSIIFSALVMIATSPFLLLVALCIKIHDGGPVLYSQERVGRGGRNFKLYKFRSMVVDAEKNGPEWSSKSDARITPVGRIIRKLHIDEVPQMINVIKGDIALVGPRPERPSFVAALENEIPFYHLRHIISPGFTGWAQIKFRYAGTVMESKEKFEYDLYYLKNRNIFIDLGIVLRTVQIIFTH